MPQISLDLGIRPAALGSPSETGQTRDAISLHVSSLLPGARVRFAQLVLQNA